MQLRMGGTGISRPYTPAQAGGPGVSTILISWNPGTTRHAPPFRILLFVCWMLSLACLSSPGRGSPLNVVSLDWIGIAKVITRIAAMALLGFVLYQVQQDRGRQHVLQRLLPWIAFGLWTIASSFWSPLRAVSFGHGSEMLVLVALAIVTGILSTSEQHLKVILMQWSMATLLLTFVVLALNYESILAGIRPGGYMQANGLGAIAGAGLIVIVGCRMLWSWNWARNLFWPAVLTCGFALFVSRSRTCLAITLAVLAAGSWFLRRSTLFILILAACGILAAAFPYAESVARLPESATAYFMRGQTQEDLMQGSGRAELWSIALEALREAPLFGHGYYVMSQTGSFRIWGGVKWQTAHNLILHVLTGTGLIGGFLFSWGLYTVLQPLWQSIRNSSRARRLDVLILMVVAWFLALGFFELSIAGPVDAAVVLFFLILGIAAGRVGTKSLS